jgi:hypothetical protein
MQQQTANFRMMHQRQYPLDAEGNLWSHEGVILDRGGNQTNISACWIYPKDRPERATYFRLICGEKDLSYDNPQFSPALLAEVNAWIEARLNG